MMGLNKKYLIFGVLVLLVIIADLVVRQTIGGKEINLAPAPALGGVISQSLYAAGGQATIPIPGKDFNATDVHYFENDNWAIATIQPLDNKFNQSLVVLQKQNGFYEVVAGPGSSFPRDYQISMPTSVGNYLQSQGAFYATINGQ